METVQTSTHFADRRWFIRLLEIFPGLVMWLFLLSPILLSLFRPVVVAYFIIAFDLLWLVKSFRLSFHLVQGYRRLNAAKKVHWSSRLNDLHNLDDAHLDTSELERLRQHRSALLDPDDIYQAVILATYNESLEILESSIQSLEAVDYPAKQIILIIAYEERGGIDTERSARLLIKKYGSRFAYAAAIKHPDGIAGEVKGKGGNITFAARRLTEWVTEHKIDPECVIVTTFDADHRPDKQFFSYLTYAYATDPNRLHHSFQPIPMFSNNIWDVPAATRVIATGTSFWTLMETIRPSRLRTFSAHSQSLRALMDTDYWNVATIVEDGHQYWRTYFTYDGDHQVVPLYVPVYQDAVFAGSSWHTYKALFLQQRRWAWGVSDFSFVVRHAISNKRIRWRSKLLQLWRQFEGNFSWATAPLILTFAAWLPLLLNHRFGEQLLAHQLPIIASRILYATAAGVVVTIFISMLSLPPRPARYKRRHHFYMVSQWLLLPIVTIIFSAFAAINAQTRLMFGRYLEFYVTPKERAR